MLGRFLLDSRSLSTHAAGSPGRLAVDGEADLPVALRGLQKDLWRARHGGRWSTKAPPRADEARHHQERRNHLQLLFPKAAPAAVGATPPAPRVLPGVLEDARHQAEAPKLTNAIAPGDVTHSCSAGVLTGAMAAMRTSP